MKSVLRKISVRGHSGRLLSGAKDAYTMKQVLSGRRSFVNAFHSYWLRLSRMSIAYCDQIVLCNVRSRGIGVRQDRKCFSNLRRAEQSNNGPVLGIRV